MRINRIFAIAAAVAALAACTKQQAIETGSSFKKGQEVTLNVTADMPATKVTSELNGTAIDFKWQEGDKIKVKVGVDSAEFTLSSGAGAASATFTGTMPADGDEFSVQYPVTDPTLTTQTYSSTEPIPHDMMKFTASDCSISSPNFTLTPQNAVLRLNFYGYDRKVSQIAVTDSLTLKTYTLNVATPVKVGKTIADSTSFFIVVDSDTTTFSVAVTTEEVSPAVDNTVLYEENDYSGLGIVITNGKFSTSTPQKLTAGGVLNMPAKSLTTVWAPVNCGYSSTYTYGLLYQWGRKYGQAYETGTITPTTMSKSDDTAGNSGKFGKYNSTTYNWFSGTVDNTLWNGSLKGTGDPCPDGWRLPTEAEFNALIANKSSWTSNTVGGVSQKGFWFNGSSTASVGTGVFLPAAGYRNGLQGNVNNRGSGSDYWSSSVVDGSSSCRFLYIVSSDVHMSKSVRAYGYSVRCVQE